MNRVVRAFLVWVMVFAMPVQGMAASAMLFCGPSHERMMQGLVLDAAASAQDHSGDAAHEMAAMDHSDHHEHAGSGAPVASEPTVSADGDGMGGLFPHHGKFSCSACAACCTALALPASFELPQAVRTAHALRSSLVAPVASHQPDGLDRPPRAVLA
jgi:hypothetical protein